MFTTAQWTVNRKLCIQFPSACKVTYYIRQNQIDWFFKCEYIRNVKLISVCSEICITRSFILSGSNNKFFSVMNVYLIEKTAITFIAENVCSL